LNVSRSYLQGDPNVKKINNHITKKVADKLDELFNKERREFEEKWESLGMFVKYGMMTDDKFLEKAGKFHIFASATEKDKYFTLEEYRMATEAIQKNKEGKQVVIYATNAIQQDAYIKAATAHGYTVVTLDALIDASFIQHMEMKWNDVHFVRVDADITENLVDKQDSAESVLSKEEEGTLKDLFGLQVPDLHVKVEVRGLSAGAPPVVATRPEFMRRMKDMAAVGGGGMGGFYANMPDEVTLTVNGNHPVYKNVVLPADKEKQEKLVRNLADLALLSQGLLKGNGLTSFIERSVDLMEGGDKPKIILEA
jgi:molecular chaperone HtpG